MATSSDDTHIPTSSSVHLGREYLIVALVVLVIYTVSCAPTVLWQDSGLFIYRIWHNDLKGNLGLALSHPLYILFGILVKIIPVGEFAWRVNMLSAIFGAIAVANLYLLIRLWLGRVLPAVIAAVSLTVSWTFWQNASWAETYTLYAAQMFAELVVLFMYCRTNRTGWLYLLAFLNGLSIANHLWALLPLACYVVYLVYLLCTAKVRAAQLAVMILLWIVGALPYEYLVISELIRTGDFLGTVRSALFGLGWQDRVLNVSISMRMALENIVFILLNFPTPNILLIFIGLSVLRQYGPSRAFVYIFYAMMVLFFAFAFRYTVADRHAFFLPFYCLCAAAIGLGVDWLTQRIPSKALVIMICVFSLLPVASYFVTPALARKYYKPLAQRRQRPYRDEYTYWLRPWKTGYRGAERFAREALEQAEKNATIYAYTTDVHSLLYMQQVKDLRPDVIVVSDYDCSTGARPLDISSAEKIIRDSILYATSIQPGYIPRFLIERYRFEKQGILYRAIGPRQDSQPDK